MQRKVLFYAGAILVIFMFSAALVHADDSAEDEETDSNTPCEGEDCDNESDTETVVSTPATTVTTTKKPAVTTKKWGKAGKCVLQVKSDDDDENDKGKNDDTDSSLQTIKVWFYNGTDWYKYTISKRPGKKGGRKGKFISVRCPIRRYPKVNKFPASRFPKLVAISPWLPIFYDQSTYQTIVYSQTGGIYVLPPVMNFYGQRFSVAQLIQWGYASLSSAGTLPQSNFDVSGLVQPQSYASNGQDAIARSMPYFDAQRALFTSDFRTNFVYVNPQYYGYSY